MEEECFGLIALAQNEEISMGVIYDPIHDQLFTAEKGKGAYLNDSLIKVSKQENLKESIMGALALYLDFVNLFLKLLRLFGKRRR